MTARPEAAPILPGRIVSAQAGGRLFGGGFLPVPFRNPLGGAPRFDCGTPSLLRGASPLASTAGSLLDRSSNFQR